MKNLLARVLLALGVTTSGFANSELPAQAAETRLPGLLRDLAAAQADTAAYEEYERFMAKPEDAYTVEEARDEDGELTPALIQFYVFRQVCDDNALILTIDWAEGSDEIFDRFEAQMDIEPEERDQMVQYVESKSPKRGDVIGWLYGPLAAVAAKDGNRIINLNTNSDAYYFAVVPQATYNKWVGVQASPEIKVEDPSWQFEAQLAGSPYAEHLRK